MMRLTPQVGFGFLGGVFLQDFSGLWLWVVALVAIAFFGYLLADSLRHRWKWRRLLKKTGGFRDPE